MSLLRLTAFGPIWPYSDAMLRADEPGTLFPPVLTAEDRAPFGVIEPQPTAPPEPPDPATERVEEVHPILVGDTWTQQWAVVPLTPDELLANRPITDWDGFRSALLKSPVLTEALQAASGIPPAILGIPSAIADAKGGDVTFLRDCLECARDLGILNPELVAEIVTAAEAANVPLEVLEVLQP